jgi:hypothetical protein
MGSAQESYEIISNNRDELAVDLAGTSPSQYQEPEVDEFVEEDSEEEEIREEYSEED